MVLEGPWFPTKMHPEMTQSPDAHTTAAPPPLVTLRTNVQPRMDPPSSTTPPPALLGNPVAELDSMRQFRMVVLWAKMPPLPLQFTSRHAAWLSRIVQPETSPPRM